MLPVAQPFCFHCASDGVSCAQSAVAFLLLLLPVVDFEPIDEALSFWAIFGVACAVLEVLSFELLGLFLALAVLPVVAVSLLLPVEDEVPLP